MEVQSEKKAIQLDWADAGRKVTVTPNDESRYVAQVEEVIQACRWAGLGGRRDQFVAQLGLLFDQLARWCEPRAQEIREAVLIGASDGLTFVVSQQSPGYLESLQSDLSELDLQVAQDSDLNLISLSVMSVPPNLKHATVHQQSAMRIQVYPPSRS